MNHLRLKLPCHILSSLNGVFRILAYPIYRNVKPVVDGNGLVSLLHYGVANSSRNIYMLFIIIIILYSLLGKQ